MLDAVALDGRFDGEREFARGHFGRVDLVDLDEAFVDAFPQFQTQLVRPREDRAERFVE